MFDVGITVKELEKLQGMECPIFLLDVREKEEWAFARLPGATLIPKKDILGRLEEIPTDKLIVVYCHHGVRSLYVTQLLLSLGFDKVKNLKGGIDAWAQEIDPTIKRY